MDNLLWEGLSLMMVGMGAVFVFLMLLVFTTSIMSVLVAKFLPEPPIPAVTQAPSKVAPVPTEDDRLLAVITAAIHRHRSRHK